MTTRSSWVFFLSLEELSESHLEDTLQSDELDNNQLDSYLLQKINLNKQMNISEILLGSGNIIRNCHLVVIFSKRLDLNVYATKIFSNQKLISTYPYMKDSTFLMLSNRTIAFKTRWMPVPSIMYILLCVPICIIPQNWKCVIYFTHIHTTSAVFQHNSIRSKEYINKLTPFKFTIELKDLSSCNS